MPFNSCSMLFIVRIKNEEDLMSLSRVKALLSEAQGLAEEAEHTLPWYPPVCTNIADLPDGQCPFDNIDSVKDRSKLPPKIADTSIKQVTVCHCFC